MHNCPDCHEACVHGQIICPHCGVDLDEPKTLEETPDTQFLPVLGVEQGLTHVGPSISLHVIEVDDQRLSEDSIVAMIPLSRLKIPVRIGRSDTTQQVPILPELDLGRILKILQPDLRSVVSRLHAALQLDQGRPAIKALVDLSGTTWVRNTGSEHISPVPPNTVRHLQDRDTIVLGHPKGRHVSLRVVLSHP